MLGTPQEPLPWPQHYPVSCLSSPLPSSSNSRQPHWKWRIWVNVSLKIHRLITVHYQELGCPKSQIAWYWWMELKLGIILRGRGTTLQEGEPRYYFATFYENLHEINKVLVSRVTSYCICGNQILPVRTRVIFHFLMLVFLRFGCHFFCGLKETTKFSEQLNLPAKKFYIIKCNLDLTMAKEYFCYDVGVM